MRFCKQCNLTYEDEVNYCPKCGQLVEPIDEKKICSKCGFKTEEYMSFCPQCGNQINLVESQEVDTTISKCFETDTISIARSDINRQQDQIPVKENVDCFDLINQKMAYKTLAIAETILIIGTFVIYSFCWKALYGFLLASTVECMALYSLYRKRTVAGIVALTGFAILIVGMIVGKHWYLFWAGGWILNIITLINLLSYYTRNQISCLLTKEDIVYTSICIMFALIYFVETGKNTHTIFAEELLCALVAGWAVLYVLICWSCIKKERQKEKEKKNSKVLLATSSGILGFVFVSIVYWTILDFYQLTPGISREFDMSYGIAIMIGQTAGSVCGIMFLSEIIFKIGKFLMKIFRKG